MTARRLSNPRTAVRFSEVVHFDDEGSGSLNNAKIQVHVPLSSKEEKRWVSSSFDTKPESPIIKGRKVSKGMSLGTKSKIMKDLGLSCPPMPPQMPIRYPSNHQSLEKIADRKYPIKRDHSSKLLSTIDQRKYMRLYSS